MASIDISLPSYLGGLLAHWGITPDRLRDSAWRRWVKQGLEVMLAPYDWRQHGAVEQRRTLTFYDEARKRLRKADLHLDLLQIAQQAADDPRVGFEARVLEAARRAQPLSPPIDRCRPQEEQRLLADIVFGDRAVFRRLTGDSPWLGRLYMRKHVITDALAFCPDPDFRREFITRYYPKLNDRPRRYGLPVFWAYQAVPIGYEAPGRPDSVFADLITAQTPLPAPHWDRALRAISQTSGVERRIEQLRAKGLPLPGAKTPAPVRAAAVAPTP